MDLIDLIVEYEQGTLSEDDTVDLFQHLINTGMINDMNYEYSLTAQSMVHAGLCDAA